MKILVTGAKGFVGKNLCAQLNNIKDGKARNYGVTVDAVYEYDLDSTADELDQWCKEADFVFSRLKVLRSLDAHSKWILTKRRSISAPLFITGVRREA